MDEALNDYPIVEIVNSTNYKVMGRVFYMSAFCSDDGFTVEAGKTWRASSRGVCLVTKIAGKVHFPDRPPIDLKPYTSSGTSYSQFTIIKRDENTFVVTRIVNGIEDDIPVNYMEPTEKQK